MKIILRKKHPKREGENQKNEEERKRINIYQMMRKKNMMEILNIMNQIQRIMRKL